MEKGLVFLGEFKWMFYTAQNLALDTHAPFPMDQSHFVNIYSGDLKNAKFQEIFEPEKYRALASHLYSNVPKIKVHPDTDAPFSDIRTYNFVQLLLIEPKVIRTFEIEGKTYGEIGSLALGITEKFPIRQHEEDDLSRNKIPIKVDETFDDTSGNRKKNVEDDFKEGVTEDDGGMSGDDKGSGQNRLEDSWKSWQQRLGCGNLISGCLSRFWSILGWFLLIWFLWSIFKSCNGTGDYCNQLEEAKRKKKWEEVMRDSIKKEYERNLDLVMSGISKIYFYKNENNFHVNSTGENSPIGKLYSVMSAYEDKTFIIEGYRNKTGEESLMDSIRAYKMRDTLVYMGIDMSRLICKPKGIAGDGRIDKQYISKGYYKEYNRNMRVEVKVGGRDE